jgi:hypothetical protein
MQQYQDFKWNPFKIRHCTTCFGLPGHHQVRWNSGELLCLPSHCDPCLYIYTHSSWSWALLVQLLKNFPAFYRTRKFITVFTRALHWSLSWARSTQSIPSHPSSLRSILILSTHHHIYNVSKLSQSSSSFYATHVVFLLLVCLLCVKCAVWTLHGGR